MLAKPHRFHGLGSLTFVYRRGQVVRGGVLSLKYLRNNRRSTFRVAVVVGRKVHKSAVVRNRIRRRIYEVVRLQASGIQGPYDLVFTAFSDRLADMPAGELQWLIVRQLRQAGVLASPPRGKHGIVMPNGTE